MERLQAETNEQPTIMVSVVDGNLTVKGWERNEVRVDADGKNNAVLANDKNEVSLQANASCYARVPNDSRLEIQTINGDLYIQSVDGNSTVKSVGGNMVLKNIGTATIGVVSGNLNVKLNEGDIRVTEVGGNAAARDVEGELSIHEVGGNFSARGLLTHLTLQEVGGNASLRLDPEPDGIYKVNAGGHIVCEVPPEASASVNLQSDAEEIRLRTSERSGIIKQKTYALTLGDGEATIELTAGGKVNFQSKSEADHLEGDIDLEFVEEFADLADEITQQVSEQIESQMDALSEQFESLVNTIGTPKTPRAFAAARRAEQIAKAAQRRAERRIQAATRRAEQKVRHAEKATRKHLHDHRHGEHRAKKTEAVKDEERQMVLQMLEEKKITVDEAELLLGALEGEAPETEPGKPQEPKEPAARADKKAKKN